MNCFKCQKDFDPLEDLVLYGSTFEVYDGDDLKQVCFSCVEIDNVEKKLRINMGSDSFSAGEVGEY